ncbi:hypothetical protein [Methanosalsum natronophilum]|uniref:hypothetical protein n=1 Tax=Methanosalsum natronophilum TaxID=768733 RepID=UPI0021686437|nr:hypothetical protein [Methanosalsum natronophilum]MCS3923912.1 hypothetical protein [Methanosalsum natronophilum]
MQGLGTDFFVFNSTGKLLSGDGQHYTNEYSSLAKQLDSKRNALYLNLDSEGNLVLGCSFLVKQVGGREERVVCISSCTRDRYDVKSSPINEFYQRAVTEIKKIDKYEYEIVGIWEEGDISRIEDLENIVVDPDLKRYIEGKIISDEKVSVISYDAVNPITVISSIYPLLEKFLGNDITINVSKYPYNIAISFSSMEPEPDLELMGRDIVTWKKAPPYSDYYIILSQTFEIEENYPLPHFAGKDREHIAREAKKNIFKKYTGQVLNIFNHPNSINKLFNLYKNDIEILSDIFKTKYQAINQMYIENDSLIAQIILEYEANRDQSLVGISGTNVPSILFSKLHDESIKKQLVSKLMKLNPYPSYALEYFVKKAIVYQDIDMLKELTYFSIPYDPRLSRDFENTVERHFQQISLSGYIDILKLLADNIRSKSGDGGKLLYKYIISSGKDFSKELSMDQAKRLDKCFNTKYTKKKKDEQNRKRIIILETIAVVSVLGIIILAIAGTWIYTSPNNVLFPYNESVMDETVLGDYLGPVLGLLEPLIDFNGNLTNISSVENETALNDTIINETIINETITNETINGNESSNITKLDANLSNNTTGNNNIS